MDVRLVNQFTVAIIPQIFGQIDQKSRTGPITFSARSDHHAHNEPFKSGEAICWIKISGTMAVFKANLTDFPSPRTSSSL
jgi:hypothetical protein